MEIKIFSLKLEIFAEYCLNYFKVNVHLEIY